MIKITETAKAQINLMLDHDFTLESKVLRISIDGKGCDGFDYAIGFTDKDEKDEVFEVEGIELHMDQFVSEHLKVFSIDYETDFENDQEGFVITDHQSEKTKGKFWLKNKDKK